MDGAWRKREKALGRLPAGRRERGGGGGGRKVEGVGRQGAEPPRSGGAPAGAGRASPLLVGDFSLVSLGLMATGKFVFASHGVRRAREVWLGRGGIAVYFSLTQEKKGWEGE